MLHFFVGIGKIIFVMRPKSLRKLTQSINPMKWTQRNHQILPCELGRYRPRKPTVREVRRTLVDTTTSSFSYVYSDWFCCSFIQFVIISRLTFLCRTQVFPYAMRNLFWHWICRAAVTHYQDNLFCDSSFVHADIKRENRIPIRQGKWNIPLIMIRKHHRTVLKSRISIPSC